MKSSAVFDEGSRLSSDAFFRNSEINQWKKKIVYFSMLNYF